MRGVLAILFLLAWSFSAGAQVIGTPQPRDKPYVGGRGLITEQGPTGMFLNPTSGTPAKGQVTAQYCVAILELGNDTVFGQGVLGTIGITDWFEAGVFGLLIDDLDKSPTEEFSIGAVQPHVRLRLLKDVGTLPELSVGAMFQEGHRVLERRTIFVAASKGIEFGDQAIVRGVRVHLGFRQFWQDSDVNEANGSIGYIGGEIGLPKYLYLVGEVSNKDDVFTKRPFSIGLQLRHPDGFGFSLAMIQPGTADHAGVYVGIGVNF